MPRVSFTQNLQRYIDLPPREVSGSTVGEALDAVFAQNPRARDYVLDERGALRKHMAVFVGGSPIRDRENLTDPVPPGSEIHVIQALSGG